jgi:hypothetical protein
LILLAFLIPLALYVLVLGSINRRRHALMVYGPWDFAGVLFAVSGFLVTVGPWVLSVFNDPWRDSLLFGTKPSFSSASEAHWQWWVFFMLVYFTVVVLGAGFFLWLARKNTSIYNIDRESVEAALERIFERLGVRPLRSGNMFYFGRTNIGRAEVRPPKPLDVDGIQGAPDAGTGARAQTARMAPLENVILEVDSFRPMCHVTLRWDPVHCGLRQDIERELDRELAEVPASEHSLGGWLTITACCLFLITFLVGIGVLIYGLLNRIL